MTFAVKQCCFCVPLRTGSLIFAYVELISLMLLLVMSVILITLLTIKLSVIAIIVVSLDFLVIAINLVLVIALIISIYKNKHTFIGSYLIYRGIMLTVGVISFVLTAAMGMSNILDVIVNICGIVLTIYFLLVLRSYYCEVKSANESSANQPTSQVIIAPGAYPVPKGYNDLEYAQPRGYNENEDTIANSGPPAYNAGTGKSNLYLGQ